MLKRVVVWLFILTVFYCGGKEKQLPINVEQTEDGQAVYFHSHHSPGKYKNQRELIDQHVPWVEAKVTRVNHKKLKQVQVDVPISEGGNHYIEAILILDYHKKKELGKVSFEPGAKDFSATFNLPMTETAWVYAVAKCNLHDMWLKRVDLMKLK